MDDSINCLRAACYYLLKLVPSHFFLLEDQTHHVQVHLVHLAGLFDDHLQEELQPGLCAFLGHQLAELRVGNEVQEGGMEELVGKIGDVIEDGIVGQPLVAGKEVLGDVFVCLGLWRHLDQKLGPARFVADHSQHQSSEALAEFSVAEVDNVEQFLIGKGEAAQRGKLFLHKLQTLHQERNILGQRFEGTDFDWALAGSNDLLEEVSAGFIVQPHLCAFQLIEAENEDSVEVVKADLIGKLAGSGDEFALDVGKRIKVSLFCLLLDLGLEDSLIFSLLLKVEILSLLSSAGRELLKRTQAHRIH